jgi:hypothetical protein
MDQTWKLGMRNMPRGAINPFKIPDGLGRSGIDFIQESTSVILVEDP